MGFDHVRPREVAAPGPAMLLTASGRACHQGSDPATSPRAPTDVGGDTGCGVGGATISLRDHQGAGSVGSAAAGCSRCSPRASLTASLVSSLWSTMSPRVRRRDLLSRYRRQFRRPLRTTCPPSLGGICGQHESQRRNLGQRLHRIWPCRIDIHPLSAAAQARQPAAMAASSSGVAAAMASACPAIAELTIRSGPQPYPTKPGRPASRNTTSPNSAPPH